MFGKPAQLNFDQKGYTHQTTCGGLFSCAYVAFMAIIFSGLFQAVSQMNLITQFQSGFRLQKDDYSEARLDTGLYMYIADVTNSSLENAITYNKSVQ